MDKQVRQDDRAGRKAEETIEEPRMVRTRGLGMSDKVRGSSGSRSASKSAGKSLAPRALTAVSVFSGGGIGDLALRGLGISLLVANELLKNRADLLRANFPEASVVQGDIREIQNEIVIEARRRLRGTRLDVLLATPPCQGMSKNGRGKLLSAVREGKKPPLDPRNRLFLCALELIRELRPRIAVFENVPEMAVTPIEWHGSYVPILDVIRSVLGPTFSVETRVIEFADFGVPQRRQRLITLMSCDDKVKRHWKRWGAFPQPTHSRCPGLFEQPWVTVGAALKDLPPLDASSRERATSVLPYHRVPLLDAEKYFWVSNTPVGRGAFDNQCVNPACGFQGNATHVSRRDSEGINRASATTPIHCDRCGSLLPRPWVKKDGQYRLMSGFTSAYKRMSASLPASALTTNLSYACSDQKLHPTQHRVLSLHEAFILHTVAEYNFDWRKPDGSPIPDSLVRDVLGESIPPKGLQAVLSWSFRALQHEGTL